MCSPMMAIRAGMTVFSAFSQYQQGKAAAKAAEIQGENQRRIGEYNAKVAEQNAELAKRQSTDAIRRGANDAAKIREAARKANARGRAIMGSSGLLTDTGTNLDLLVQNTGVGELDALTLFNNAEREAYGFDVQETDFLNQARNLRAQGDIAVSAAQSKSNSLLQSGLFNAGSTLVTGAQNTGLLNSSTYGFENIKWNDGSQGYYRRTGVRF